MFLVAGQIECIFNGSYLLYQQASAKTITLASCSTSELSILYVHNVIVHELLDP